MCNCFGVYGNPSQRSASIQDQSQVKMLEVSLKPNPASDHAQLSFNCETKSYAEVQVQDVNGKLIQTVFVDAEQGANEIDFQTESWKPGMYFVYVQKGTETAMAKIVKQ